MCYGIHLVTVSDCLSMKKDKMQMPHEIHLNSRMQRYLNVNLALQLV